MTYARARLWTGITGVGVIVVASIAAIATELPQRLLEPDAGPLEALRALAGLSALIAVSLLPLDVVGGLVLPLRHGQETPGVVEFARRWLRGATAQCLVFTGSAWAILQAGRAGGAIAAIAAFGAVMALLIVVQGPLARLVGGLTRSARRPAGADVAVLRSSDPSFTGGLVGWPGRERVVIPERWFAVLGEDGVAAQIARRKQVANRGWRTQGLVLAVAWNLAGFALATSAPGVDVARLSGLVTAFCWLNLWSFIGLLSLPWLSRGAVFAADAAALQAGVHSPTLTANFERIDRLQDDESERSVALESVFHPVPSSARRSASLGNRTAAGWAPWNVARTALYLSWAGFGLLSRAVHCNSGKPELWVLLPCD